MKIYPYLDANGSLLFQVVREEPKAFLQRRRNPASDPGEESWIYNLDGVPRVLYRLPEILAAVGLQKGGKFPEPVFVCEGEKDVDALAALGLAATTNSGGAFAPWLDAYTESLRGAELVVVLPDNDAPGGAHAAAVAGALRGAVGVVKLLALPGLPEKGDVSDWIEAGGTREELLRLADRAPKYEAAIDRDSSRWTPLDFEAIERDGIPEPDFLFPGWIVRGDVFCIAGDAGSGKSTLLTRMAYAAAAELDWCGITPARKLRVLYIDEEQSETEVYQLFTKHGPRLPMDDLRVFVGQGANLDSDDGLAILEREVAAFRPDLVLIDSATATFGNTDGNSNTAVGAIFRRLFTLRSRYGVTIGFLHHLGKPGELKRSMMHRVLGSVAFTTQSSAVWGMVARDSASAELLGVKRRGIARPYPAMVIGYREEKVDDRVRTYLENLGPVVDPQGQVVRAAEWVNAFLSELGTPTKRDVVIARGAEVPPPEGPHSAKSIEHALRHLLQLGAIQKPKRGWYQATRFRGEADT